MIAIDIRHIDPARRSGLALMAARWALNFSKNETSFCTTPICCHQWPKAFFKCDRSIWPLAVLYKLTNALTGTKFGAPLSPRQRYVRQQSDQAANQGFSGGGILHLTRLKPAKTMNVTFYSDFLPMVRGHFWSIYCNRELKIKKNARLWGEMEIFLLFVNFDCLFDRLVI